MSSADFPVLHAFLEKMRGLLERPLPNPDKLISKSWQDYLHWPDSGFKNGLYLEGVDHPAEMRFYGELDRELTVAKGEQADTAAMVRIENLFKEFKGKLASEGHAVRVANRGGFVHIHVQGVDSESRFRQYLDAHRFWNRPMR